MQIDVSFQGPFRFIGGPEPLVFNCAAALMSGLYLWVGPGEDDGGWIIYVGETGKPYRLRFLDHLQRQLSGSYSAWSIPECRRGQVRRVWSGYGWRGDGWRSAIEHLEHLERRAPVLREYLEYLEIWLAPLPDIEQLNKRAEAALLEHLRKQGGNVKDMVTGNRSHGFSANDRPFTLLMSCPRRLHGFPVEPLTA
ncbi:MAG: hypothetical protein IT361_06090 [Gemmatimonadaceae bacterium]|nr:hypothetical protein [Gemmatimonadaceae bacterium]